MQSDHYQHQQQQVLDLQISNLDTTHDEPKRRSANYKPTIWKSNFLQSLTISSNFNNLMDQHARRVEKLKMDVKNMFVELEHDEEPIMNPLATLELIDKLRKLGLASLFEPEINKALHKIAYSSTTSKVSTMLEEEGLYAIALCFRLLRLYGYHVSQDMLLGFKDAVVVEAGTSIRGMLELFEASHLGLQGENILDEARAYCSNYLKSSSITILDDENLEDAEQVVHALKLCSNWRLQWFDVRRHINAYEKDKQRQPAAAHNSAVLLELAKLNFHMNQAAHQNDLQDLSWWWSNLGLAEDLKFARDRLVESFMCSLGLVFEAQHKCFRKWITKVVNLIVIIDDVYDLYGSPEELYHFTNAVHRWDGREVEHLPQAMKICFKALHDVTIQTASEIQEEKGWDQHKVLPHLKKVWADFCKALLVEAEWCHKGHTPTLQEYLNNAWISSSGSVILVHAFFAVTHEEENIVDFLEKNQDLMYHPSLIIRLCNDLATSVAEKERGDVASSILCCMEEFNVSEETARKQIKGVIMEAWKKINEQCIIINRSSLSPSLQSFLNITANSARVAHYLYHNGDGFGVQDREIRSDIMSLLIEPLTLN